MKGLLIKEFYVIASSMKITVLFLLFCACIPGITACAIPLLVAAMFPMTTFIYDDQSKWQRLQAAMPYQKRDIVLSKYVFGVVCVCAMTFVTIIAQSIVNPLVGNPFTIGTVYIILGIAVVSLLMQAFLIPLTFRFGAEKARIVMIILVAIGAGLWVGIADAFSPNLQTINITTGIVILFAAVLLSLYFLSIFASTKLYRVRQ